MADQMMTVFDEQKGKNLGDSASQERTSSLASSRRAEAILWAYLYELSCSKSMFHSCTHFLVILVMTQ